MIARLGGIVIEVSTDRLVVDCAGVGYEILVPMPLAISMNEGSEVNLYIRTIIREDGWFLFGFADPETRHLFDLLREVKGCGPKTSLAVLGSLGTAKARDAISSSDTRTLTAAPGVGARLAERIIVELKDKVAEVRLPAGTTAMPHIQDDLVEALIGLGYRRLEAESAAAAARLESEIEADQLKAALRRLRV